MCVMSDRTLPERMRDLADSGHERADELRDLADELEETITDWKGVSPMLATWMRARRIWCEITGEPLV